MNYSPALHDFSRELVRLVYDLGFRGEVAGCGHVPRTGPFIVAANHASFLDPPLIGAQLERRLSYFARKSLFRPGLAKWWLDGVGTLPVDRDGGSDVAAVRRVLGALRAGQALILFPEGTRTSDGRLQPPKPGVGLLACRARVPVVPCRIFGSFEAYGRHARWPRLGVPVSVVFGPALAPDHFDPGADHPSRYPEAAARIQAAIARVQLPALPAV